MSHWIQRGSVVFCTDLGKNVLTRIYGVMSQGDLLRMMGDHDGTGHGTVPGTARRRSVDDSDSDEE